MPDSLPSAQSQAAFAIRLVALVCLVLWGGACKDSPEKTDTPPAPRFDEVVRQKRVTVYPALVWAGEPSFDHEAARSLGAFVAERTAGVEVSREEILPYSVNLSNTRDRANIAVESIAQHLRTHPLRTDLGLWPVYLLAPGTDQVVEIQAFLFNGRGRVVRRFKIDRVDPQVRTPQACTEQVKQVLLTRERIYAPKPAESDK
jgi:hypothetical protein